MFGTHGIGPNSTMWLFFITSEEEIYAELFAALKTIIKPKGSSFSRHRTLKGVFLISSMPIISGFDPVKASHGYDSKVFRIYGLAD